LFIAECPGRQHGFSEKIFLISVGVDPTLDDIDGVVDAFKDAGIDRCRRWEKMPHR